MSYTYLLEQGEESSAECFSDIPPSVLSRSKNIPEKSSCNGNETESCHGSRSGTTSAPSTENRGGGGLIYLQEDFLAKTFQLREQTTGKNLELPASVQAYGENIKGLLEKLNLVLSSRKTPRCCELEGLSPSSKTLPAWGMMLDGVSWEVGTSARIIKEIESGYLPTVLATDWKGGCTAVRKDKQRQRLDQWRDYVKIKYGMTYPHPTHSELRMGWPEKWTDLKPLETDKYQSWLKLHSEYCPQEWSKVVFAYECGIDPDTEEPFEICPVCSGLYSECDCIGPTEDGVEYKEISGELYGRRL